MSDCRQTNDIAKWASIAKLLAEILGVLFGLPSFAFLVYLAGGHFLFGAILFAVLITMNYLLWGWWLRPDPRIINRELETEIPLTEHVHDA